MLGPPSSAEIKDTIQQIKAEGANFINVPAVKADWPFYTAGREKKLGPRSSDSHDEKDCKT